MPTRAPRPRRRLRLPSPDRSTPPDRRRRRAPRSGRARSAPTASRDLEARQVRRGLAQPRKDVERHGVPTRPLELVHVERCRVTGARRGHEVGEHGVLVELEVGRRDHRDPARLQSPRARPARPSPRSSARRSSRSLRARRRRRARPRGGAPRPRAGSPPPSSRAPGRRRATEGTRRRSERLLVERRPAVAKRRQRRGKRPSQHGLNLRFAPMTALRSERDGSVLRVTLNRPDVRNAFDAPLIAELTRRSRTSATRVSSSSRVRERASAPAPTSSGCARRWS